MTTRRAFLTGLAATLLVIDDPFAPAAAEATAPITPTLPEGYTLRFATTTQNTGAATMTVDDVMRCIRWMKDHDMLSAGDLVAGRQYAVRLTQDGRAFEIEQHARRAQISARSPEPRRFPGATPQTIRRTARHR